MYPVLYFQNNRIVSYDLMELLAYLAFSVYIYRSFVKLNIKPSQIYWLVFLGFIVYSLGGMILPMVYQWFQYHRRPQWKFWQHNPGRFFHSVVISGLCYFLLISKIFKWPTKKIMDHFAIGVMLSSPIGRIGCFLQGCCGGKLSTLPWAMTFPRYPNARLHPAQLYMFFTESFIFLWLIFFNKRKKFDGETFWVAIFLYSVYRFFIEYVRTNPMFIFGLTHAQVFSLFTFFLSLIFWYQGYVHRQRKP